MSFLIEKILYPNQCGSVGWASLHKAKGHGFSSGQDTFGLRAGPQSAYMKDNH